MVDKKPKITYVLPVYWSAIGGCELHTRELVKRLSPTHDLNVITLIDNQKDKLSHELWMACILTAPKKLVEYKDGQSSVMRLSLKPLEKLIHFILVRIQTPKLPDFVISYAMELLSILYMKKLNKLIKGSDLLHCIHGGVSYLGYAALKTARYLDIPFIYTPVLHLYHANHSKNMKIVAGGDGNTSLAELSLISRGYTDKFWLKLCHLADALVTMTDFESHFFTDNNIAPQKIVKIGIGPLISEISTANGRCELDFQGKKFVLFLGRNVEYKGIEEILQATRLVWQQFPATHFVFAGPKEGHAEEIFRRYRDPRIHVLGSVSEEVKSYLLKNCAIFCMPSLEESLGGTFLEAWVFEKPIIAAKIPPVEELTADGEGGFLVKPIPDEIASKINILIQNPKLRQKMGKWGKKRVLENYTWEIITDKLVRLYASQLLTAKPSSFE